MGLSELVILRGHIHFLCVAKVHYVCMMSCKWTSYWLSLCQCSGLFMVVSWEFLLSFMGFAKGLPSWEGCWLFVCLSPMSCVFVWLNGHFDHGLFSHQPALEDQFIGLDTPVISFSSHGRPQKSSAVYLWYFLWFENSCYQFSWTLVLKSDLHKN